MHTSTLCEFAFLSAGRDSDKNNQKEIETEKEKMTAMERQP